MKQKGQVFSLDVLISIVLITAALGVAMRFFELKEYETKELTEQLELERVGNTASELLVNNPDLVCELTDVRDGAKLNSLSNCLNKNKNIGKPDLGIAENSVPEPNKFDCYIEFKFDQGMATVTMPANGDCSQKPQPAIKNVFAATREIVLIHHGAADFSDSRSVPKDKFNYCSNGDAANCNNFFAKATATIKVWKHE